MNTSLHVSAATNSPLGPMRMTASTHGLLGIWFEGQRHEPQKPWPAENSAHPVLQATSDWLARYFLGAADLPELPLDWNQGTEFQRAVWQQLRHIARGQVVSYGEIARSVGRAGASRAVGAAVGRNPWSILVPCHRVVGASGQLTGYAGGLDRKVALLKLEHAL